MNEIDLTSEVILATMLVMVKAQASYRTADTKRDTQWFEWCSLRLAYYPSSDRHRWFGPDGAMTKADAILTVDRLVRRAERVPA